MARQRVGSGAGGQGPFNPVLAAQQLVWANALTGAMGTLATNVNQSTAAAARQMSAINALSGSMAGLAGQTGQYRTAAAHQLATTNALSGGTAALAARTGQGSAAAATAATAALKVDKAYRTVGLAYGLATAAIGGWVRAGLAGTTIGERLSWQTRQLSMQIASLFVPWIEKGIAALQGLTERFRALSGEQQQQIAWWAAIGTGLLGALTIVPKLVTAFQLLGTSLATTIMANPILALTAGVVALLASTDKGRASLVNLGQTLLKALEPVARILADRIVPIIQRLADLLSQPWFVEFAAGGIMALERLLELMERMNKETEDLGLSLKDAFFGLTQLNTLMNLFNENKPEDVRDKDRPRTDVVPSRTGTEDARATIRRLEESVLKTDTAAETARNTKDTADILKEIWRRMNPANYLPKQDNRDDPPKND